MFALARDVGQNGGAFIQGGGEVDLTRTEHPDGSATTTAYNGIDKPERECDALARCTVHAYDARGNRTRSTYADGTWEETGYDANGNVTTQRDRGGRITRMVYDRANRPIETIHPDASPASGDDGNPANNPRTRNEYDDAGRLVATVDENGRRTEYRYDDAGRRTQVIAPPVTTPTGTQTAVITTTYDAAGQRTAETDALGRTTRYQYDAAGRLTTTVHPDVDTDDGNDANNPRTQVSYDAVGRKIAETDEAGRTTRYAYDRLGRLIAVALPNPATGANPPLAITPTGPGGGAAGPAPTYTVTSPDPGVLVTTYAYDERGNRVTQTDAAGRATRWTYDRMGREVSRTLPLGQVETKTYNEAGELTAVTDFTGKTTRWTHDATGRVATIDYPNDADVTFGYTATGQRSTATDGHGTTTHAHDARDRLVRRTDSAGRVIEYTYDAAGNLTSRVTASQALVYRYDARNRLIAVESSIAGGPTRITRYAYDAHGTRTQMIASDGTTTDYRYDRRSRLRELVQRSAAAAILFSATYTTDAAGLRTGITEADATGPTRTVAYTYDATRRLTQETIAHRDATRDRTTAWTYDRVGNRLTQVTTTGSGTTQTTTTVTSEHDANDRLTREEEREGTEAPRITTTTYDANGNTTRKEGPDGVTEYAWDDANRLKEQRTASGRTEYRYDADGLRIGQTTYPTTGTPTRTDYLVDPTYAYANVIERWEGEGAASTKLAAVHVFGEGIVGQTSCTPTATSAATDCPNATERVLHADGFGSTRYLTNAAGTITDRIDYDAFGTEIHREGDTDVEYLYRGEQYDANLGFYYLRARYMDPARGRFASMDPFAGFSSDPMSLHKYTYAHQDPITHQDPSGYAVLIGTMTLDAFLNVAVTGYRNAASARRAYSAFDRVRKTMCKGCDQVGDTLRRLDKHHTLPVFMGGKRDQPLLDVPEEIHRSLHTLLHYALVIEGFGAPNRGRFYDTFTGPGGAYEQRRAYAVLLRVSRYVDAACLGVPNYQRIAPVVRRMIRTNQIDF